MGHHTGRLVGLSLLCGVVLLVFFPAHGDAASRLLRQPTISEGHVVFSHGGDLWVVDRDGGEARRLTSTPAVEDHPQLSPDGSWVAFSSNRSGIASVYVVPIEGGTPTRLTWYPAPAAVLGWTPDGARVLYASTRETAPVGYDRLWTVALQGGPSQLLPAPWGHDGSYSADGSALVVERVRRWDVEWRHYRGGQNTPLVILDLGDLHETRLPNERTIDIKPVWMGGKIYFLSDRSWVMNIWSFDPATEQLEQLTDFDAVDVKWLNGYNGTLVFERAGWLHTLEIASGEVKRLEITVRGDFPWAEPRWEDVSSQIGSSTVSPTGKRALFAARGEIFTVPAEKGSARNLTNSPGAADRRPLWSPLGNEIAWFSDAGQGYELLLAAQDGLAEPRRLALGGARMVWEPTWSPDGKRIAFVDSHVQVQVIELSTGEVTTVDAAGANIERGNMGLTWSPDSAWLAYTKTFANNLHRVMVWSVASQQKAPITNALADAVAPSWDRGGKYLYFVASTNLALASGWANTSTMQADPTYAVYLAVLQADEPTPFAPESDEEPEGEGEDPGKQEEDDPAADEDAKEEEDAVEVLIDLDGIQRRILAAPMDLAPYVATLAGPKGTVFVLESTGDGPGARLHKLSIEDREASVFLEGVADVSVSGDGQHLLVRSGESWRIVGTDAPPENGKGTLEVSLLMWLDRPAEWQQIFDEAWRYERDFFYDPGMHGRDWNEVREQYAPLVQHVHHRNDLNYILDQVNGELSVGHSFVFGGDYPEVDEPRAGVLGADLAPQHGLWQIARIYTFESWNPKGAAPLDRPGLKVAPGHYLLAVDGVTLSDSDDPYRLLDGTAGRQIELRVNDKPSPDGAWEIPVEPIANETALRQLAWVEDNRRRVDELSDGTLAYVWVPNTSNQGVVSFNRYFFAQQDKLGAVIDERFNGGGLLDDYMVDLMTRKLRAAITNEVPNGKPFRLPAGILGPKVLLINEMAGSGGDYFPWVFRQQQAGPLIGTRTWGGLVKSSVHYLLVDGGGLTAPDNAVFDPIAHRWVAENQGVPPDIEVLLDARSVAAGKDPQLERGVQEALRLLEEEGSPEITPPPFPTPAAPPDSATP